jgi:hypothetical protein
MKTIEQYGQELLDVEPPEKCVVICYVIDGKTGAVALIRRNVKAEDVPEFLEQIQACHKLAETPPKGAVVN